MAYELPQLPYPYNALEPYIDAQTMEIHHSKHHQAYVDKLNAALASHPDLQSKPAQDLLVALENIPEEIRTAVRNNGGGHVNHSFFWTVMKPPAQGGGGQATGSIAEAINKTFGSFEEFKKKFTETATTTFGSGWTWLVVDKSGGLAITSTPNQDSPLSGGLKPLLAIDLWEHAYYLKYQNRRLEYIEAWWNVVNWEEVEKHFV